MKRILLSLSIVFSTSTFSQTFTQAYQNRVDQISQANINTTLTEFANLGVKKTGSVSNNNAFTWLKSKYLSFGYTEAEMAENAFSYQGNTTKNLIIT